MSAEQDARVILDRAQKSKTEMGALGVHLQSRVTVLNYVRIADEIQRKMPQGQMLDWGCGFGQMSFLLQRRGLTVSSYDIGSGEGVEPAPLFPEVMVKRNIDPVKLPYPDMAFDAVLSCGVLEHVPDENGSLGELRRVLKPGGLLFIYNLPQRFSYKEFLLSRFHLGYTHERKYTRAAAEQVLTRAHLYVRHVQRSGMLPQNFTPVPQIRGIYNRMAAPILFVDRMLSAVPLLNHVGEALEIIAVRPPDE